MPIPITNPYGTDPSRFKISGRISPSDFQFFKDLFPADGTIDATVATLFHNLVHELRTIHATTPLERAWYVDSPAYGELQRLLSGRTAGQPVGQESPRDEPKGTGGVHQVDVNAPQQRPVTQSSPSRGRRGKAKTSESAKEK